MLARVSALAAILACLGCAVKPPLVVCLDVKEFTKQQQADISAALKKLPPDSPLGDLAVDWERMRLAARACNDGR